MLRITRTALLAASILASTCLTAAAQDQEDGDIEVNLPERRKPVVEARDPGPSVSAIGPIRVYGGFNLALGGKARFTIDNATVKSPLDPSLGFQLGGEYVAGNYFSIGGETRFIFFKDGNDVSRNFLWDLVVKPKGRYVFPNLPLEVYGALPIGLTVPGLEGDTEGKAGLAVGLVGGATWFFTEHMGVNTELGWTYHRFGVKDLYDSHVSLSQFLLLAPNFVYVL